MRIFGACVIELHPRAVTALCLALSLSACGIGGMWMNGHPSVSRTLVPPRDTWQKMGNDGAARYADWRECGGAANGGYHVSTPQKSSAAVIQQALGRTFDDLQHCMMRSGYRYTGSCEGEIRSRYPACQSPGTKKPGGQ